MSNKRRGRKPQSAERVGPTPETVAKGRGCIVRALSAHWAKSNTGLDPGQVEAAYELYEAHYINVRPVLTASQDLNRTDRGHGYISARGERLLSIYRLWAPILINRRHVRPMVIVEMITMERPIKHKDEAQLLARALDDWSECAGGRRAERRAA